MLGGYGFQEKLQVGVLYPFCSSEQSSCLTSQTLFYTCAEEPDALSMEQLNFL